MLLSPRIALRVAVFFVTSFILTGTAWLWNQAPEQQAIVVMPHDYEPPKVKSHPIDYLIKVAEGRLTTMLKKETHNLTAAADAYRKRRGRHPPPGFDQWFAFARDRGSIVVEDFFDQIYHDIAPFWAIEANRLRRIAKHAEHSISVRGGKAKGNSEQTEWTALWLNMTREIEQWLPDVDIPLNIMDESRVIVPWEEVDKNVGVEKKGRVLHPSAEVNTQFSGLNELDANPSEPIEIKWEPTGPFWDIARVGCSPDSLARGFTAVTNYSGPPPTQNGFPKGSFEGFVQNWTDVRNPCQQPDIRESHGTFIEPVSQRTTHELIPIFSSSKLPMSNDILIPAALYWSDEPQYYAEDEGKKSKWEDKQTKVMWRGNATGGRNKKENWTRFQRHRFVNMLNGTAVQVAERNPSDNGHGPNFILQSYKTYQLTATQYMDLGSWLDRIADVGMVDLQCHLEASSPNCPHTDPYFKLIKSKSLKEQLSYKFLPVVDGNSFSSRYRTLLRSSSLPIKATIYSEWHDSRLIPWLHFVPMDNSFVDIYGILDYFIGTGQRFKSKTGEIVIEGAHDDAAKQIALAGKEWADKVLRKEDMLVYVMRLLMEFARVCDSRRDKLGFVADLKQKL
jgi:hypothetical protein